MTGGNGVGAAARTRTAAPDVQLPAPCEHHHEKKRNRTVNANNLTDGMSQQERTDELNTLALFAQYLGAVEHSWVADGMLCRRYITLTVRIP